MARHHQQQLVPAPGDELERVIEGIVDEFNLQIREQPPIDGMRRVEVYTRTGSDEETEQGSIVVLFCFLVIAARGAFAGALTFHASWENRGSDACFNPELPRAVEARINSDLRAAAGDDDDSRRTA
ncbi:hypothetical protein [Silvimonas sp.]|uniref:hypothetical protein n=1 Tax=Silvimonas sp. TaxID=2650811 RepID=UPI00283CDBE9|nr:hypothetical protein [Silvimonas sp.]MDR3430050.1 hypothetical protein [Silvimonas sp.]